MQVRELMSEKPEYIDANASIQEAATRMREQDRGFVPIADGEKLVGVLTDRDIALRTMTEGIGPTEKVSSIMTTKVLYCYQDEDVRTVLQNMQEQNVQRMAVLNNEKNKDFVGVVSLSDIAGKCDGEDFDTMRQITHCCRLYH